jgi:competence protein ComEC
MKRPLGWVALMFGGGVVLGEHFRLPLPVLFLGAFASVAVAAVFPRLRPWLLWPIALLAGWTDLVWRGSIVSPHDLRILQGDAAEIRSVRGTLTTPPQPRVIVRHDRQSWSSPAELRVDALNSGSGWQPAFGRVAVSTPGLLPGTFHRGSTVEITGVLAPPPGPAAEGLFDYRAYLGRQGIYFQLKTESSNDWQHVGTPAPGPPASDRFRSWAHAALARGLPCEDESLRLEWALTLGDKSVLTEEVSEPFVRAATFHIFAVDGLRMAILFGIFYTVFRALRLPRPLCGLVLLPLIWWYTALTGWPASAIRASVMLTIIVLGWALKRPGDLLNSLFAAALIILIGDPQQLFQAGFQLSFTVVICMIVTLPVFDRWCQRLLRGDPLVPEELRPGWWRRWEPAVRYVLDLAMTSFAAWVGSIPLVAYYFNIATPVSTPANVVAVPLCALVLVSNFSSLLLAGWFPAAAELFNHAGWFLMECIRVTSVWFADWPRAYWYVAAPGLFSIALYYLILLAALSGWLFAPALRRWKWIALGLLCSLWCWQRYRAEIATRLFVLPLNGGGAVYVDAPGQSRDLLIDCGDSNAVQRVTRPFFRAHGVNRLPCLALTHGDTRQVGGAQALRTTLPVAQVATSPVSSRSPAYRRILADLARTPEAHRTVARGQQLSGWTVLHPGADDHFAQGDDNALVLFADIGGTKILLLSDLGCAGQERLLARWPEIKADILVTGLPDKSDPAGDELLDAVKPRLIVITDSEYPATRRTSAAQRDRLALRQVPILCTRETGALTITLSGTNWAVRTVNRVHQELP